MDKVFRMVGFCKTKVPEFILEELEKHKSDDEEVRNFGTQLWVKMCQEYIQHGIRFLHFYTLNLERSVIDILETLNILDYSRDLPFKKPSQRAKEDVRPIFWANKPKSYISRTKEWDEFPNGRWGVSRSAAFGEAGYSTL